MTWESHRHITQSADSQRQHIDLLHRVLNRSVPVAFIERSDTFSILIGTAAVLHRVIT